MDEQEHRSPAPLAPSGSTRRSLLGTIAAGAAGATFFGPCIGLDFATRVGFVSDAMGSLDKFGSILVDGHECYFRGFTEIGKPGKW